MQITELSPSQQLIQLSASTTKLSADCVIVAFICMQLTNHNALNNCMQCMIIHIIIHFIVFLILIGEFTGK